MNMHADKRLGSVAIRTSRMVVNDMRIASMLLPML
jgi:hypothetical protein